MNFWNKFFRIRGQPSEQKDKNSYSDSPDVEEENNSKKEIFQTQDGGTTMSTDLITSENLSTKLLKSIFDDAYFETTLEDEDMLYVKDGNVGCYVFPGDSKSDIRFVGYATPQKNVSLQKRYEFANRANSTYKYFRAYVGENGRIAFDYYLLVNEGITKKTLVLTLKRLINIPIDILNECDTDGIFG